MIFHSYVNVHQRITNWRMRITWLLDWVMFWVDKGKGAGLSIESLYCESSDMRMYFYLYLSLHVVTHIHERILMYTHTHIYIHTHIAYLYFFNAFAHTYISIYNII